MPKITALPNTTIPATDDLLPFVDVSATPTTRKATVANLAASTAFTGHYAPRGQTFPASAYGAISGGSSAVNAAAVQAAVDAAEVAGGVVFIDVAVCGLGTNRIVIPDTVGLRGLGRGAQVINFGVGGGFDVGSTTYGDTSRHPLIADLYINATNQAALPLFFGGIVNTMVSNVRVANSTGANITLKGCQNSIFVGLEASGGGQYGIVLDSYVFNCHFFHPIVAKSTVAGIYSYSSEDGSNAPRLNKFFGGMSEPTSGVPILINSGVDIQFYGTQTNGSTVTISKSGLGSVGRILFNGCQFKPTSGAGLSVAGAGNPSVVAVVVNDCYFRTGTHAVDVVDTNVQVALGNNFYISTLTSIYTSSGTAVRRDALCRADTKDQVWIPSERMTLITGASGTARGYTNGQPAITFTGNTNESVLATVDPVMEGIQDWVTYSVTFVWTHATTNTTVVRWRAGAAVALSSAVAAAAPAGTGGAAIEAAAPGVANQIVHSTPTTANTAPTANDPWTMAFGRNGGAGGDTSVDSAALVGVYLTRLT